MELATKRARPKPPILKLLRRPLESSAQSLEQTLQVALESQHPDILDRLFDRISTGCRGLRKPAELEPGLLATIATAINQQPDSTKSEPEVPLCSATTPSARAFLVPGR
eukprot:s842_g14.t1